MTVAVILQCVEYNGNGNSFIKGACILETLHKTLCFMFF